MHWLQSSADYLHNTMIYLGRLLSSSNNQAPWYLDSTLFYHGQHFHVMDSSQKIQKFPLCTFACFGVCITRFNYDGLIFKGTRNSDCLYWPVWHWSYIEDSREYWGHSSSCEQCRHCHTWTLWRSKARGFWQVCRLLSSINFFKYF